MPRLRERCQFIPAIVLNVALTWASSREKIDLSETSELEYDSNHVYIKYTFSRDENKLMLEVEIAVLNAMHAPRVENLPGIPQPCTRDNEVSISLYLACSGTRRCIRDYLVEESLGRVENDRDFSDDNATPALDSFSLLLFAFTSIELSIVDTDRFL